MAGVVHIPWYATVWRGGPPRGGARPDRAARAAPRRDRVRGATARATTRYKLLQMAWFESKLDWQRYWDGPDFVAWRAEYSSFYQVPILYVWHDTVLSAGSRSRTGRDVARTARAGPS